MLRDEDLRIDIGAVGGTFFRVTHLPTQIYRTQMPPTGAEQRQAIQDRLLDEIEAELRHKGLTEYIR